MMKVLELIVAGLIGVLKVAEITLTDVMPAAMAAAVLLKGSFAPPSEGDVLVTVGGIQTLTIPASSLAHPNSMGRENRVAVIAARRDRGNWSGFKLILGNRVDTSADLF